MHSVEETEKWNKFKFDTFTCVYLTYTYVLYLHVKSKILQNYYHQKT